MRTPKAQKIDLNAEYPCPSCRGRGRLSAIALTEAFGCSRCQRIFVLEDNYQVIEQLASTYPYKRAWRWIGHRWVAAYPDLRENYLAFSLTIVLALLLVGLPLALKLLSGTSMIIWAIIIVLLMLILALMVWPTYRR